MGLTRFLRGDSGSGPWWGVCFRLVVVAVGLPVSYVWWWPILMWSVRQGALQQGLGRLPVQEQELRRHYGSSPSTDEALSSRASSHAFDD